MMVKVALSCRVCHEHLHAEVDAVDCGECDTMHPHAGTLTGDWLIRWVRSHQDPVAVAL